MKTQNLFLEVDVHGLSSDEAKKRILQMIKTAPSGAKELSVIHGYRSGDVLAKMVRTQLKHPRIKRKIQSLNRGVTILLFE